METRSPTASPAGAAVFSTQVTLRGPSTTVTEAVERALTEPTISTTFDRCSFFCAFSLGRPSFAGAANAGEAAATATPASTARTRNLFMLTVPFVEAACPEPQLTKE